MNTYKILIADDDELIRWPMEKALSKKGYDVITAKNGKEAVVRFSESPVDIVLLDYMMPLMDGLEALNEIKKINRRAAVIMLTAVNDAEVAVQAMKQGACDYIIKTSHLDLGKVFLSIDRALEAFFTPRHCRDASESNCHAGIIYSSEKMKQVMRIATQVMTSDTTTVLLQGESGTGKNLIAKAIHDGGKRGEGLFVEIDCGAIPGHLLESELFGHEKGSFTDAKALKKGLFEIAAGGTIFLDEIGEMPVNLQAKLLKFIEEKRFRRVGGIKDIQVDARFIAASNKDLAAAVKRNEFRADLFYRLNVIALHVPSLRERKEDIMPLATHFLDTYNKKFGKSVNEIPQEVERTLCDYGWPGNIRELKNSIERGVLLSSGRSLDRDALFNEHEPVKPESVKDLAHSFVESGISLEDVESNLLAQALHVSDGNQSKAARMLNIGRDSLRRKMKKYGLVEKINYEVADQEASRDCMRY